MNESYAETNDMSPQQRRHNVAVYSAHMQEAMRYDRLRSSEYHIVMTIFHAVSQGYTEERWKEEQQQRRTAFPHLPSKKESSSADEDYEQLVLRLKELKLWPW